jgi:hypothetical protein
MRPTKDRTAEGATGPAEVAVSTDEKSIKRPYVAPKIERLGTILELTQGLGNNNQFDGSHPPGQNKSIV